MRPLLSKVQLSGHDNHPLSDVAPRYIAPMPGLPAPRKTDQVLSAEAWSPALGVISTT